MFGMRKAWSTPNIRQRIDSWLHWIPGLRELLTGLTVSRFAHVLGLSLQSRLGLIEALELYGRSSGRPLPESDAGKMSDQVKNGGRLSEVLLTCKYLPGFARRMIASGEVLVVALAIFLPMWNMGTLLK